MYRKPLLPPFLAFQAPPMSRNITGKVESICKSTRKIKWVDMVDHSYSYISIEKIILIYFSSSSHTIVSRQQCSLKI